jgi:hypothetical protein
MAGTLKLGTSESSSTVRIGGCGVVGEPSILVPPRGTQLIQELVNDGLGAVKGVKPEGDKKIHTPFFCLRWIKISRLVREHTYSLRP